MTLTAPWSSRLLWIPQQQTGLSRVGSDPTGFSWQQTGLLLTGSGLAVHDKSHVSEGDGLQQHHRAVLWEAVLY